MQQLESGREISMAQQGNKRMKRKEINNEEKVKKKEDITLFVTIYLLLIN